MTTPPLARLAAQGPALRLTLDRPARHNALVPELIDDVRGALSDAARSDARALVLTGAGRSFSTGGDIGRFLAEAGDPDRLVAYARDLIGGLNAAILDLLRLPCPVIAAVNGPVTGGALGLMLAADLAALSETAFLQPYYGVVGFAPDGGWTALLPERIGASRAVGLQAINRRLGATEAVALGIGDAVAAPDKLAAVVDNWVAAIAAQDRGTLAAGRRLVWDAARLERIAARLEAERIAFCELVARPSVRLGMERFLASRASARGAA